MNHTLFIEQTFTETCTFQHAQKFPMTSVCDILLYLSISFSVYVAQTQSLFGACCLRILLHLWHYLDRVHSDLKQHLFRAVSAHNMLFEQCQGSALPQQLRHAPINALPTCSIFSYTFTCMSFRPVLLQD